MTRAANLTIEDVLLAELEQQEGDGPSALTAFLCPFCRRPIERYRSGRFRYHVTAPGVPCQGASWRAPR